MSCSAYGCSAMYSSENPIRFFQFPNQETDTARWKAWRVALRRKDFTPRKTSLICQDHFKEEDFYPSKPSSKIKRLKRHAVPSIFQFPAGVGPRKVSARSTRTSMAAAGILDCKDDRDIFLKKSASGNNHNDSPYSSKQGSVKETDKATKVRWKAEWNFTAYDTFLF